MYLLDANACIRLINDSSAQLKDRFRECHVNDIKLSSIVVAELVYGAYNSTRVAENLALLARFTAPFTSLTFDNRCAYAYGRLCKDLQRADTPTSANDMMIAATALAYNIILVSHNTREFRHVPGLQLEDWEV